MPGFHRNSVDRLSPATCPYQAEVLTDAEVSDPTGSVVDIMTTDPVGSTGGSGWCASRTVAHAGKEEGYSDPGNGSQRPTMLVDFTVGNRQSSAGGCNRVSPVGRDDSRRRGWKRSIKEEDDENSGGFRGSVHVEEMADKRGWRDSDVQHIRNSCSCLHCCSVSGGGGTRPFSGFTVWKADWGT